MPETSHIYLLDVDFIGLFISLRAPPTPLVDWRICELGDLVGYGQLEMC